jgi:hypothetical protein
MAISLHLAANKCFAFAVKNSKIFSSDHEYTLANIAAYRMFNLIRDLDVTVDSSLKFDKHVSLITHKALELSFNTKIFRSRDRLLLVKAFCTYVRPLLEYCCVVWSPNYHYLIDKIERSATLFLPRDLSD